MQPIEGGLTYHDPCYLGGRPDFTRLAKSLTARPPASSPRCGARGALVLLRGRRRAMYMEERSANGNVERTEEALATRAKTIAVGCPFCSTMITDATRSKGAEDVEVIDVASVLLRAVKP